MYKRQVRDLAGYTLGRSDLLRRAMSKKKADVMARERQKFVYGEMIQKALRGALIMALAKKLPIRYMMK